MARLCDSEHILRYCDTEVLSGMLMELQKFQSAIVTDTRSIQSIFRNLRTQDWYSLVNRLTAASARSRNYRQKSIRSSWASNSIPNSSRIPSRRIRCLLRLSKLQLRGRNLGKDKQIHLCNGNFHHFSIHFHSLIPKRHSIFYSRHKNMKRSNTE